MALTAKVYSSIKATVSSSGAFGTESYDDQSDASPDELTTGTGDGEANVLYESKARSIAASSSETLDLNGSLTDVLGAALDLTSIKAIEITAYDTNTNNVVVGGAGSDPWVGPFGAGNNTLSLPPGASILLSSPNTGWAVVASTGDQLKVANSGSGSAVEYDIKILGF